MNEWLEGGPTPEGIRGFLAHAEMRDAHGVGFWAGIWLGDELAGAIGLEIANRTAGIGSIDYLLGPAFRGRGVLTRAASALVAYAFESVGLHRLEILPDVENARSRAVAERLGFRLEGVLRDRLLYADGRGDQAIYALLRSEWAP